MQHKITCEVLNFFLIAAENNTYVVSHALNAYSKAVECIYGRKFSSKRAINILLLGIHCFCYLKSVGELFKFVWWNYSMKLYSGDDYMWQEFCHRILIYDTLLSGLLLLSPVNLSSIWMLESVFACSKKIRWITSRSQQLIILII